MVEGWSKDGRTVEGWTVGNGWMMAANGGHRIGLEKKCYFGVEIFDFL